MRSGLAKHLNEFGHRAGVVVNEDPAFVYLKVTKAAGTSILRHTLEKHPEQLTPFHLKDHRAKTTQWLSSVTDEALEGYYFFTVVRNPWDRFLSLASYVGVPVEELARDFETHMENPNIRHHAHPQWICSHLPTGEQFADRICRVETLQFDMNCVFDALGLPRWDIPVKNTTQHRPYRDVLSKDVRDFVANRYAQDISIYGYEY